MNTKYPDTKYPDLLLHRRTVLVVVMNNVEDMRRVASEGWYRIPQRRAPRRIGADYLAFYQTGKFKGQPEAQTVTFYAPTRRYQLLTRAEMIPEEAGHQRANDYYFRIELGPLQRLDSPISPGKHHRLTFIHTTMQHLLAAGTVHDLYYKEDPFEKLWRTLREHGLRPLQNRVITDKPLDITLRARGGYLGIHCTDEQTTQERPSVLLADRWELLNLSITQVEQDLEGCLRQIGAALIGLGGSVLNR